jgi:hypothetical protein
VRVDPQHDLLAEVAGGHLGRRDPAVAGDDETPHPGTHSGAGGVKVFQAGGVEFAEGAAQGGWGGYLAEQVFLMA